MLSGRFISVKRSALRAVILFAAGACASAGTPTGTTTGSTPPPAPWVLLWSDEFDGPAGAPVSAAKWVADTGGQGWGNREREYYTARPENVSLDGQGDLAITVRAEPQPTPYRCWYGPCAYTSARIKTQGRFSQAYGRFEARIKIPRGQGIWPAFWMLGNDIGTAGWPACGEIDVMEVIGREPGVLHGTMHGPGYSGANGIGGTVALPSGAFADAFHVYAVEWTPNEIRWLLDGVPYFRTTPEDLPAGTTWVYQHPFFLLLNVAIGGSWPGDPDSSTVLPQEMVVDYVRVYGPKGS